MRIRHVLFSRAQYGWLCEITFTYNSAAQFTSPEVTLRGTGRGWLRAFWDAYRAARRFAFANQAKPGERAAKGWAE